MVAALTGNLIRPGHAACRYSWRMPPRRSRLRMSRLAIWAGSWPMSVVKPLELPQCIEQVPVLPDQGPVQQFTPAGLHPTLHDRVHARHPGTAENDLDPHIGKDSIEQGGELLVPVPDQEPHPAARVLK